MPLHVLDPAAIKLYHIVHVDRLASIAKDGKLFCDSIMAERDDCGTVVGMSHIKERRLATDLESHPGLKVGQCVPFYFCPRSVMLYLLHMGNHSDLNYKGGQRPIVHLQFALKSVVEWADANNKRWAFTLSNAGAAFFEDRADLSRLVEINWEAVKSTDFRDRDVKEGKQAEFLVERCVPWSLVEAIGIHPTGPAQRLEEILSEQANRPKLMQRPEWYY